MKKITSLILLMFCTLVGYSQIISTGFETGVPAGWIITHNGVGVNSPWYVNNTAALANSGTSSLMVAPETATASAPIQDWVITSATNLTGILNPKLSFYGKASPAGPTRNSRLEVRVSTTNTNLTSFTTIASFQDFNSGATNPISSVGGAYGFQELSLLPYAGQNIYIAFVMVNQGQGKTWNLDDILVFEDCPDATNLGVTNLSENGGTATWLNPGGATNFQTEVVLATATPTGVPTYTNSTTTTTQIMTGLLPNTTYKYYVRSTCINNVFGDWIGPFEFDTNPLPAPLPYVENFEAFHGWRFTNGTQPNKWFVGSATQNGGAKSMYISNNDGAANIYTIGTNSTTHTYRDVIIPPNTNEILFTFDYRGEGQTTLDFMSLWSVPTTFLPTAGTQIVNANGVQIGGVMNLTPNYTNRSFIVNVSAYAGTTRRFVFEWRNNNSAGTQPPASVDNINISVIPCTAPTNLVLGTVGAQSAQISWTAPAFPPASYDYYVSQNTTPPTDTTTPTGTSTTNSANVTGLAPGSSNYIWVRSNCGTNGKSVWIGFVVAHINQVPVQLPYSQGFESGNHGFQFSLTNQPNYWMVGNGVANAGNNSLYITNNNQNNEYTITQTSSTSAFRDFAIPAGTTEINLQFDFKGMGQGVLDRMRVWLVPTTFIPTPGVNITAVNSGGTQIGLTNYSEVPNWVTYNNVINVSAFAGANRRIVFEWVNNNNTGTQPPAAVDNININVITCVAPSNIVTNTVNQNDATLSWTAPTSTNIASYDYYYSTSNVYPTAATAPSGNTTATSVLLQNLSTATQYYFWVRSNCGSGDGNSFWVGPQIFTTTQIPATLPYTEKFDSNSFVFGLSNGTQVNKWMVGTSVSFSPTKSLYISSNENDYNYNITSASVVHAYRDLAIPAGAATYNLNFVYKYFGQANIDFMKVWLVPSTYNLVPGAQIIQNPTNGAYPLGAVNPTVSYQAKDFEIAIPANLTGQTVKLVFEWVNNDVTGNQGPASVDNITFKALTCKAPTDIEGEVSCADASIINLSWTPRGTETMWEYLVLPLDAPTPSTGNVVTMPEATHSGLTLGTDYTIWVRAICGGENGNSEWVSNNFYAGSSPVASANPFCAGPEGILFDNVYNAQNVPNLTNGNFHCLGTTPNPVWYFMQVDQAGPLNFQIVQNTLFNAQGQPVGTTLDVDYIAFGPFNSLAQACEDIIIAPGSPNPNSKIVGCSYSAAAVENFNIPNAQPGQVYAILITNFNGAQGKIKFVQTNATAPGAGNTDCNFLCEVKLGPDRVICGTETTLNAQISTVGTGDITSIKWYLDGDLMDPTIYNTLSITVNQSGIYTVDIDKDGCTTGEPIVDDIEITFVSPFNGEIPESLTLCDFNNDNEELFDLQEFTNQFLNGQQGYNVTYHDNLIDANAGFGVLPSPYLSSPKTIFVRVANATGPVCARVEELELILKTTIYPVVDFVYPTPICVNGQDSISPELVPGFTLGGTFSSTPGLVIDSATGEIDLEASKAGLYDIKYDYPVSSANCGDSDSHIFQIRVLDRIGFLIDGYCRNEIFTISATDILGTLNFSTATFKWSNNVISSDKSIATVDKPGTYSVTVTTADGCVETAEIVVTDIYCLIQKGISPNGDGLNDTFVLKNLVVQKLQIFNRHGKEVYSHGPGYTNQWQGQSNNGAELPSGTYFYTIVTPYENFTGWIQVVREQN
ncbi:fibronectin type III domain-containing protein [Flavobacterium sp. I3-2]|uniref:fibronectin type III domain-containing protein n=1 Tax=Flavobacterium sp. I3-2 TaxID=2748319 RepID=UPI0015AB4E49|nr:fibronectin type III domain-containing protein [Flavobacterium sp. I3-2]